MHDAGTLGLAGAVAADLEDRKGVRVPTGEHSAADVPVHTGLHIQCEPGAIIRGESTESAILVVPIGEARGVRIEGGEWRQCAAVLRHDTDEDGNRAVLHSATLRDLVCRYATTALDLRTCVGCAFERLAIELCNNAIVVDVDSKLKEFFAANRIVGCRLVHIAADGLRMTGRGSKAQNVITGCWLEHIDGDGIAAGDGVYSLSIRDSLFAWCGNENAELSDVRFANTVPRTAQLTIDGCAFMRCGPEPERVRVRVSGAELTESGNWFSLYHKGQRAVVVIK